MFSAAGENFSIGLNHTGIIFFDSQCRFWLAHFLMVHTAGTTWMQQIVWLIINSVDAMEDDLKITKRFPFIEYYYQEVDDIAKRTSPRLIKSHMPYGCLPAAIESGRGKVMLRKVHCSQ